MTPFQQMRAEAAREKPSEALCTRLGRALSPQIETLCTETEIALALGVSRTRAHQLCCVALGKFAFYFFKRYGMPESLSP